MGIGPFIHQAIKLNYDADIREGVTLSAIGYCEMQTQNLYVRKEKKNINPANLLAMRTGTATHDDVFKLLYKWRGELDGFTYKFREREVTINTPGGNTIKGHLDLCVEIDGRLVVADLKVIDEGPFGYLGNEPRQHEKDQTMMYAAALGVTDCLLVYLCKGGKSKGQFKEYPFAVDPARVKELGEKYDRIIAGKAGKPFSSPDESWECGYCPYYEECWGVRTFTQKQPGVVEIPLELEEEYFAEKSMADEHKDRAEEIKEKIEAMLGGKRGEGRMISAYFTAPKESVSYDSSLLKIHVPADILKKCAKSTMKSGFYRINIRGEK